MKRIFLHIGRHKSGTTAIQLFFHRNRKFLAKQGLYYPQTGIKNAIAHHFLAKALNPALSKPAKMIKRLKAKFEKEIENRDNIVISSEAFQNINKLNLVVDFFSGYELIVICYFREVLDYHQSAYAQFVQASDYQGSFLNFSNSYKTNYVKFYQKWNKISDNMIVSFFNRSDLLKQDVVHDFLEKVGVTKAPVKYKPDPVNSSIGGNLIFFKLCLNMFGYHSRDYYNTLSSIANKNKRFSSGFFISPKTAQKIRANYSESNKFLKRKSGNLLLKTYVERPPMPDYDFLEEDFKLFLSEEQFKNLPFMINENFRMPDE